MKERLHESHFKVPISTGEHCVTISAVSAVYDGHIYARNGPIQSAGVMGKLRS